MRKSIPKHEGGRTSQAVVVKCTFFLVNSLCPKFKLLVLSVGSGFGIHIVSERIFFKLAVVFKNRYFVCYVSVDLLQGVQEILHSHASTAGCKIVLYCCKSQDCMLQVINDMIRNDEHDVTRTRVTIRLGHY